MTTLAARQLSFSEPEKVLECLREAQRGTDWDDVSPRLRSCMEEVVVSGLAVVLSSRQGARFGRARKVLELSPAGRKRLVAANRAAQSTASAPVEWRGR